MELKSIIENSLYFLALINPTSKIFLLSSFQPPFTPAAIRRVSIQSTIVAFLILLALTAVGNFLFHTVFRIEVYSLKVAGGIVLFMVGLNAVRKGSFYEKESGPAADFSIVPLGAPLIAGPGTIAAAISFSSEQGVIPAMTALTFALLVNFILMLAAQKIGRLLERLHSTGPLIRITGLIVAAVAVQMILGGLGDWLGLVFPPIDNVDTGGEI
jgi:multiple antibiotic resistance protein